MFACSAFSYVYLKKEMNKLAETTNTEVIEETEKEGSVYLPDVRLLKKVADKIVNALPVE